MKKFICGLFLVAFLTGCSANTDDDTTEVYDPDKDKTVGEILEERAEEYKEKQGITLNAEDVQFDMVNNLDTKFLITGTAKLDDYYNYGFTNEKDYFSTYVSPDDNSDGWYVFFERDSYSELYEMLKDQGSTSVYISAVIPKNVYKQGQGNMAVAASSDF
ncbi:hypothetical protein ACIQXQ_20170 [Peribacillus sp. NPDC097198]|uniref:hypothetical protein n=1 Tax=Peribacillus sp. NPDC097198 TaxID=3364397 RepID=UPI00381A997F